MNEIPFQTIKKAMCIEHRFITQEPLQHVQQNRQFRSQVRL